MNPPKLPKKYAVVPSDLVFHNTKREKAEAIKCEGMDAGSFSESSPPNSIRPEVHILRPNPLRKQADQSCGYLKGRPYAYDDPLPFGFRTPEAFGIRSSGKYRNEGKVGFVDVVSAAVQEQPLDEFGFGLAIASVGQ